MHFKANEPSLKLKRNELGLRLLKSNPTYAVSLVTLDERKDHEYDDNILNQLKKAGIKVHEGTKNAKKKT